MASIYRITLMCSSQRREQDMPEDIWALISMRGIITDWSHTNIHLRKMKRQRKLWH